MGDNEKGWPKPLSHKKVTKSSVPVQFSFPYRPPTPLPQCTPFPPAFISASPSPSMNLPRYWQWLNEPCAMMRCSDVGTSANTLAALQREWGNSVQPLKKPSQVPNILTAWWISPRIGNSFQNCQQSSRWRCNFKGTHRMGTSLFNENLSNEPTFSQISLNSIF